MIVQMLLAAMTQRPSLARSRTTLSFDDIGIAIAPDVQLMKSWSPLANIGVYCVDLSCRIASNRSRENETWRSGSSCEEPWFVRRTTRVPKGEIVHLIASSRPRAG